MRLVSDLFGLGWRDALAASITAHLARIDVVEVIAEEWTSRPDAQQRALRTLGTEVPVVLHATSLGLASTWPVQQRRLSSLARLIDNARPAWWSEHLAFVRAGGVETGHLAAPPRSEASLDGLAANVALATRLTGSAPALENVATLVVPPCSEMDETAWVTAALSASDSPLLLDLHNLHANAVNHGFDARAALDELPLERVRGVHLAGGRWLESSGGGTRRLLDDHLHDVPDPVFALLEELAARSPHPLTVILERDGRFPPFGVLLAEIERARQVVAAGRARRAASAA
jgi:uncharacterized protein (UPF0276 family)